MTALALMQFDSQDDLPTTHPESAYDVLPLGVCIVDESFCVNLWNRRLEQWTGVDRDEIVGSPLADWFPEFGSRGVERRIKSVFRDRAPVVLSAALHSHFLPIYLPDGKAMPQRTHLQPLGAGGNQALIVIEDLSQPMAQLDELRAERRRLEESEASLRRQQEQLKLTNQKLQVASQTAEQANRSKSEFLANMSHEIRTPLTAILGFSDILVREEDPDVCRTASETIRRNGKHLLSIVNDVLDLSKIEAGMLQMELKPCRVLQSVEQVLGLMRSSAQEKGIGLRLTHCELVSDVIQTDPTRLRQILLNLIGNAIKFTDEGRVKVTLSTTTEQDAPWVRVTVEDSGIGIPREQLGDIFEPFTQVDSSAHRRHGGTGLGLTICSRLAGMLGGRIEVTSDEGIGSRFTLLLPAEDPPQSSATDDAFVGQLVDISAGENGVGSLAGRHILLAEDGIDNQRLIEYHLRSAGAEVSIVPNGLRAVDAVFEGCDIQEPIDLVLMDLQMPVMDGYEATKQLRTRGHRGPVVALTAHAMQGDRDKALAAGCDDYATKPIDAPALIRLISRRLRAPATLC